MDSPTPNLQKVKKWGSTKPSSRQSSWTDFRSPWWSAYTSRNFSNWCYHLTDFQVSGTLLASIVSQQAKQHRAPFFSLERSISTFQGQKIKLFQTNVWGSAARRHLTNVLLLQEYYDTVMKVRKALEAAWGITIIVDGCTDIQGNSIYATIYVTTDGLHLPGNFEEVSSMKHDRAFIRGRCNFAWFVPWGSTE